LALSTPPTLYRGLNKDTEPLFRTENFGRLLLLALVNWQEALVHGLQEKGFKDIRSSHISLLRHIDSNGTRITDIAERAGITKQAVGQLIKICESLDLVSTTVDNLDRRAKIVAFTEYGRKLIAEQQTILSDIDDAIREKVGDKEFYELRDHLIQLSDWSLVRKDG
tara:strand:- start:253 stop:750 length:498 start_codon:yes stop_codon:yes gene_type:complete